MLHRKLETETNTEDRILLLKTLLKDHTTKGLTDYPTRNIFKKIIAVCTSMIQNVFSHNANILQTCLEDDISLELLPELQENLMISINLLQILRSLLDILINSVNPSIMECCEIPKDLNMVLYSTFFHCKHSKSIYKVYFKHLKNLEMLFQNAQEMQSKLLWFMETKISHVNNGIEVDFLSKFLNSLCETGIILSGLNASSMVKCWKSYSKMFEKFGKQLPNVSIEKSLEFISSEVCTVMSQVGVSGGDEKHIFNLKIGSFLLKVALKILENSLAYSNKSFLVLNFFSSIYTFSNFPNDSAAKLLETYIFKDLTPQVLESFKNLKLLCHNLDTENIEHFNGFFNILMLVLPNWNPNDCSNGSISSWVKILFGYLKKNQNFVLNDGYSNVLANMVAVILLVDAEEFYILEELLLMNLLQGNVCQSILAHDMWDGILRHVPPTLSYDTLTAITEKCKFSSGNLDIPPHNLMFLRHFLSSKFNALPKSLQLKFLEKYPPEEYLCVWSLVGIAELPSQKMFLRGVIEKNLLKRLDVENVNHWNAEDFLYIVHGLGVLARLTSTKDSSLSTQDYKLWEFVVKLWKFNCSSTSNMNNFLFGDFIDNLGCLSASLVRQHRQVDNTQLFQLLSLMKTSLLDSCLVNNQTVRIQIWKVLNAVGGRSADEFSAVVFTEIANLISALGKFNNETSECETSLRLETMNIFSGADWANNLSNISSRNRERALKEIKPIENKTNGEVCKENRFNIVDVEENATKKIKLNSGDVDKAADIIDNIRDEVKELKKLANKGQISKESSKELFKIVNILNQLI